MGRGKNIKIFIYRIPYHRALETKTEFSIVRSYLGKIIRQTSSVLCIITMALIYLSKEEN